MCTASKEGIAPGIPEKNCTRTHAPLIDDVLKKQVTR